MSQAPLALVTGAGTGIGRECAIALAKQGYRLLLVGRRLHPLAETQAKLGGDGHRLLSIDISRTDDRQHLLSLLKEEGQGLDLLINNAGSSEFSEFATLPPQRLEQLIDTNITATLSLTQTLLPMLKQRKGTIINIGSTFGAIGYPGFATYCATKFALRGFSQALRRELADEGVTVCYLAPRATQTDINTPQVNDLNSALGNASDSPTVVAQALLRLLRKPKAELFIGWPECFFARLNALLPDVVGGSLIKQMPIIRRFW